MSRLFLLLLVSGLIFLGACPPPVMAETADSESLPDPSVPIRLNAAEREIHAELSKPTQMDVEETPLEEVVEFLEDHHDIEIQLTTNALDEIGIGSDTPVTIRVRDISLRSGLRLMLDSVDPKLTFEVCHEVLLITTRQAAAEKPAILVYDVRTLLQGKQSAEQLTEAVALALELDSEQLIRQKANKPAQMIAKDRQKNEADINRLPSLAFFNHYMLLRAPEEAQHKVQQLVRTLHRGRLDQAQKSLIESLEDKLIAEKKLSEERISKLRNKVWELERQLRQQNRGQGVETNGAPIEDADPFGSDPVQPEGNLEDDPFSS